MNHIVTGPHTFIGKHLLRRLREVGHTAYECDFPEDVEDVYGMELADEGTLWHLYGNRSVYDAVDKARFVYEAAKDSCSRLVFFSSANVYGRGGIMPLTEDDHLHVGMPYTKRTCDQVANIAIECMAMADDYENIQIIRPENVVGPGQPSESGCVMPRFDKQARNGGDLTVYGDGSQSRTFLSVHDLVDFCVLLSEQWPEKKRIWNVGGPKKFNCVSIIELANLFREKYGCVAEPLNITYTDPPDHVEVPGPLTTWKQASKLGYKPTQTLASIISELRKA